MAAEPFRSKECYLPLKRLQNGLTIIIFVGISDPIKLPKTYLESFS